MRKFFREKRKTAIFTSVLTIHLVVIISLIISGCVTEEKPREVAKPPIAFRVKLGSDEPSHAPEVGPPEKIPPAPTPVPPVPTPPVPELPAPPQPQPPAPPPPPKPPVKKTVKKPKKTVKKPKKTVKPVKKAVKKTQPKKPAKKAVKKTPPKKPAKKAVKKTAKKAPDVYHDSSWDNFDPNAKPVKRGGSNTNKNVQIGTRDRGQKRGQIDSRTPAGGKNNISAAEEAYIAGLQTFIMEKWVRPPGILIDENTAVIVEISINAYGRVIRKRIVKRSPNGAVNYSAQRMLDNLSEVTRPPHGAVTYQFRLIPE